jgi:ADP-ribose pyrophosphatase YjhB (NUDIX family)
MSAPARTAGTTEIIARAVVARWDSLLVVRDVAKSWSFLPGGHVEPGERVEDALVREISEELGAPARVGGLFGVVEHGYIEDGAAHHELNFVFAVHIDQEDLRSREDHLAFTWVPRADLPGLDLRPRAVKQALIDAAPDAAPFWHPWQP